MNKAWMTLGFVVNACSCYVIFEYEDFNVTTGLSVSGDAFSMSCDEESEFEQQHPANQYSSFHGVEYELDDYETYFEDDKMRLSITQSFADALQLGILQTEGVDEYSFETMGYTAEDRAEWLEAIKSPYNLSKILENNNTCAVRVRLTSSNKGQQGSIHYNEPVGHIIKGFSSSFSFKVSNPSVKCVIEKKTDPETYSRHTANTFTEEYRKCTAESADGLVFWISTKAEPEITDHFNFHADSHTRGLWEGDNTFLVKLDHHYNPDKGDVVSESVAIFLNNVTIDTLLTEPAPIKISDSKVHKVWIEYSLTSKILIEGSNVREVMYSIDNDLSNQIAFGTYDKPTGVIVVYYDIDGESSNPIPVSAGLIALDNVFNKKELFVGLSAATGDKWATHDILSFSLSSTD